MFCIVFKSKKWYCLFWHRYCTILKVHLTQITCRDRRWCRCSSVKAWTTGFSRRWHPRSSKCKRLMAPPLWMRHAFSFSHLHFHGCWLQFNSQTWTVVNRCTWQSPVQPDAVLQNLTYSLSQFTYGPRFFCSLLNYPRGVLTCDICSYSVIWTAFYSALSKRVSHEANKLALRGTLWASVVFNPVLHAAGTCVTWGSFTNWCLYGSCSRS